MKLKFLVGSAIAFATLLVSSVAFAQAAPVCQDEDHDGYVAVIQGCTVPQGAKLDKSGKPIADCDDHHSFVNPGAQEIWDNGIDDNCDGFDQKSMADLDRSRFERGLGYAIPKASAKELKLHETIRACQANSHCHVDWVGGQFTADNGYYFVDAHCTGKYEVIDQAGKDRIDELEKRGSRCKATYASGKSTVSSNGRGGGPSASYGAIRVLKRDFAEVKTQASEALKMAKAADEKLGVLDATVKGQGEHLSALDKALAEQSKALSDEVSRATAAENALGERVDVVGGRADEALSKANNAIEYVSDMYRSGVVAELSLGGTSLFGQSAKVRYKGKEYQMRGNASPGAYFGANIGYANPVGRFVAFGNLLPLGDEGPDGWQSSVAWQTGAEATFASLKGLGFHVLYNEHNAGGSVVAANAYSRGVGAGLSYVSMTAGRGFKAGFQARATVGGESYGAGKGSDSGFFAGISLGVNFGFGPAE